MESAETYFQCGMKAYLARDYEESVVWFTKALAVLPDNVNYYYYRGVSYEGLGNTECAVEDYTRALERYPGCVPIRYSRAGLLRESGNAELAAADLTYIIVHADREKGEGQWLALAYLNRGLARIDAGDLEPALVDFEKAETIARELDDRILLAQIGNELDRSGL